jgi:hypothetical protein
MYPHPPLQPSRPNWDGRERYADVHRLSDLAVDLVLPTIRCWARGPIIPSQSSKLRAQARQLVPRGHDQRCYPHPERTNRLSGLDEAWRRDMLQQEPKQVHRREV